MPPITKCAYKKAQQQIKEEAFQDGDFLQKAHQYLSSLMGWRIQHTEQEPNDVCSGSNSRLEYAHVAHIASAMALSVTIRFRTHITIPYLPRCPL